MAPSGAQGITITVGPFVPSSVIKKIKPIYYFYLLLLKQSILSQVCLRSHLPLFACTEGHTVPVEAAYQIWRVTKVLSMGKVHTHI